MAKGGIKGIILKIGGDTSELSKSIDQAYTSTGKLQSELTKVERALKLDPKNVELSKQKLDIMKQSVTETEQKLKLLKEAQQKAKEAFDSGKMSAEQYREISRQVVATEGKLSSLKKELGKLESKWVAAGEKMQAAGEKMSKAGKKMSDIGGTLTKGVTAPILAVGAGMTKLATDAGAMADEMLTLSAKTGISTDQLQKMSYAARFIDTELETMTGSMVKLTKNMDNANKGTKDQQEAFAKLGVEYKNTDGTLRNSHDVWLDTIDALGAMANETDRDAISLRLFGRSAQELNPLIKAGSEQLNAYGIEAQNVGAIIDSDTLGSLGKLDDSMQRLQAKTEVAKAELGAAFVPVLEDLTPILTESVIPAIKSVAEWFGNLDKDTQQTIISVAGLAAAVGPLLSVAGKTVKGIGDLTQGVGKLTSKIKDSGGLNAALSGPKGAVALVGLVAVALKSAYDVITAVDPEVRKLTDSFKASKEAYKDTITGMEGTKDAAKGLIERLDTLAGRSKKTAEEKAELASIVGQLNELYPDLNLQYDKERDSLNKTGAEIDRFVEARSRQIEAETKIQYVTQLYKDLEEARRLEIESQNGMVEQSRTFSTTVAELLGAGVATQVLYNKNRVNDTKKAREDIEKEIEQEKEGIKELYKAIEETNADTVKSNQTTAEENADTAVIEQETLNAKLLAEQTYQRNLETAKQKHMSYMGGIDDEGLRMSETTAAQWKINLEQQLEDYKTWSNNIKIVASQVAPDVAEYLYDLGPDAAQIIADMSTMSKPELDEFEELIREQMRVTAQGAEDEISYMPQMTRRVAGEAVRGIADKHNDAYYAGRGLGLQGREGASSVSGYNSGANFGQGYVNAIWDKVSNARSAATALAVAAGNSLRLAQRERSPSKMTRESGINFSLGYILGIKEKLAEVKKTAKDFVGSASDGLSAFTPGLEWASSPAVFDMPGTSAMGGGNIINIGQLVVREEADVERVASKLYAMQKREERKL